MADASSESKRISITIPEDILAWMDEQIARRIFYNYQHGVELALSQMRDSSKKEGAFIQGSNKKHQVVLNEELFLKIDQAAKRKDLGYQSSSQFVSEALESALKRVQKK